ncbi:MAG: hypothetical protein LBP78_08285, partial [Acidaminococcales bacterium]|nr:hypothetical protein [Acidaminococcales bacterium]
MRKLLMIIGIIALVSFFVKYFAAGEAPAANGKYIAVIRIQGPIYGTTADSITGRLKGADEIMR